MIYKITFDTYFENDKIVKQANLNFSELKNLWFKFPKSVADDLTDRADPFVYALSLPMMTQGGTFEFDGNISKSVIDNIVMYSRAMNALNPEKYKQISILANQIDDDFRPNNKKMITAFSGGLDAAYTTYKYKKGLDNHFKYEIDKSVIILGADIPVENKTQFEEVFAFAKKMTDDLNIELIPVETNYRKLHQTWLHAYGSVVVSALNFFSKKYFYGAGATGDTYLSYQAPCGFSPLTDQFLSNDTFRFITDGREHTRTQRASFLKDWKALHENLHVCWVNKGSSENCGKCEKCIRTKLNFKAVGVDNLPCMPNNANFEEINDDLMRIGHDIIFYQEIYDYAKSHKTMSKQWLDFLKQKLYTWNNKFNNDHQQKLRKKHKTYNFLGIKIRIKC